MHARITRRAEAVRFGPQTAFRLVGEQRNGFIVLYERAIAAAKATGFEQDTSK
jgi:hypothetical protein